MEKNAANVTLLLLLLLQLTKKSSVADVSVITSAL